MLLPAKEPCAGRSIPSSRSGINIMLSVHSTGQNVKNVHFPKVCNSKVFPQQKQNYAKTCHKSRQKLKNLI